MPADPTTTNSSRRRGAAVGLLTALALAAPAAAPAPAAAAGDEPRVARPTFSLTAPTSAGTLRLRARPGDVLRGAVVVRNASRHDITVKLRAADIANAANGNADYVTRPLSRTGRWLRLEAPWVRLRPGAVRRVGFNVRVPAAARGGSHYAGIVAYDARDAATAAARKSAKGKSFNFYRINRQALPVTVRLPGPVTRSLALRSTKLTVEPVGAGLVLGLLPGGSKLIRSARVKLRVLRDNKTVFKHLSGLGQLFPGSALNYRIPWQGTPTDGSYRVLGVIRPKDAAEVQIDETVTFTSAKAAELEDEAPPAASAATSSMPPWVWLALTLGAALLVGLSIAVWKLARRPAVEGAAR